MTDSFGTLLVGLTVMLVAAKSAGELSERLGQPAVVGELLVGIVLGNLHLAGLDVAEPLRTVPAFDALAGIGVVLLTEAGTPVLADPAATMSGVATVPGLTA